MKAVEITEKINNKVKLEYKEIEYMVNSYVKGRINDETMSNFVWAIYNNGLSMDETYYLTDVMIKSGETIDLSSINKKVVDKHSTGGVGDKITLIVSPIVACAGVAVPKMSGRGLGLTGGTVDKLESIIYSKENKLVKLKGKFNSEYIKLSIDLMEQLKETNPTEAIGKAKELIESCCKTILDYFKIQYNSTDSISKLTKQVFKELKISPEDVDESDPLYTTLKQIYGNLSGVSAGLGELRNAYGSGHGKSDDYKGLDPRYSKLAVGCATTLVTFLWDCFEQQKSQK